MLPIKLEIKQVGPYDHEVIDFESICGDVTAITGRNGAGKTMMIDSMFAALYRFFPYRDTFYNYCRGRDAQIALTFSVKEDGGRATYQSVLNIDAVKRDMEPWLYRNGEAITDGKNGTFDAAITKLLGSSKLALVSVYSTQEGRGRFTTLAKADRKGLFIQMTGLSILQAISDLAHKKSTEATSAYDLLREKFDIVKFDCDRHEDTEAIKASIAEAERRQEQLSKELLELGLERAGLAKVLDTIKDVIDKRQSSKASLEEMDKDIARTKSAIVDCEKSLQELETLRPLANEYDKIEAGLEDMRTEQGRLNQKKNEYLLSYNAYTSKKSALEKERSSLRSKLESFHDRFKRAEVDSAIISGVPCRAEGECAECEFLTNAIVARDGIDGIQAEIDNLTASLLVIDNKLSAISVPPEATIKEIDKRLPEITRKISENTNYLARSRGAKEKIGKAEASTANLESLRQRLPRLEVLREIAFQDLKELEDKIEAVDSQRKRLAEVEEEIIGKTGYSKTIAKDISSLVAALARAEDVNIAAEIAREACERLEGDLRKADLKRRAFSLLAKAFGPMGIQSLEIDALGPAVSDLANKLLFTCFGPRFSLRFVTQVAKANKSGYKDEFDIYVMDSNRNEEESIGALSGGERVIVGEALSLAISLFNQERSSVSWDSLFRDEASSAIDDVSAPFYISMLRRARELGHFKKLYFVAHQVRVTEQADSRIEVTNGQVKIL